MDNLMYGSIHTHFEDMFDTANNLPEMVKNFASVGAKKVALTGHGNMFAYEDLKACVKELKEKGEVPTDFEIIPGVEIYFGNKARHMVLVAKDYEGYSQLCRVISESASNRQIASEHGGGEYDAPIVTLDNLKENITGGHVYATSACVGGVLGAGLGLEEEKLERNLTKAHQKVEDIISKAEIPGINSLDDMESFMRVWEEKKADPANKKPTKAEREKAFKAAEKGDGAMLDAITSRDETSLAYEVWKGENKATYDAVKKALDKIGKSKDKERECEEELQKYRNGFPERFENAKALYKEFEGIFGKDNFYFELQNHGLPAEKTVFNNIVKLAFEVGNPHFIASNDVHIGDRKGSPTWEVSLKKRAVEKFGRFKSIDKDRGDSEEYGIKTNAELKDALLKIVEPAGDLSAEEIVDTAISNIEKVLTPCHVQFPEISINGINFYPKYSDNEEELFVNEVEKGLARLFPEGVPENYRKRADYEMGIIKQMGYCGYHLIVKDYLEYGRLLGYLRNQREIDEAPLTIEGLKKYIEEKHIPMVGKGIGPGRGSAAGSLACYALGIVDADPIKYGLLFERFLNPSRQSMPDIDSDFKEDIRDKVYDYIRARYGDECVSKVCTKSYAYGKAACGIASRYLAELHGEEEAKDAPPVSDNVLYIPKGSKLAIKDAIKKEYLAANAKASKDISLAILKNGLNGTSVKDGAKAIRIILDNPGEYHLTDKEAEVLELADRIQGIPSTISMHACACIISGTPLKNVIPLAWNEANRKMTTQCLYPQAEELGLLKMDLLGLKNLGVITRVMQALESSGRGGEDLLRTKEGVQKMLEDPAIYRDIFSTGRTKGVFQFESDGMAKMLKDFKPTCFEDIVILVAAYRPGPIGYIPEIIATKRHLENPEKFEEPSHLVKIKHPLLQNILAPTYGVPIYQEQVMKIFQDLAGYDLAGADNVRRFMSKKKTDKLEHERDFFVYGSEYVKARAEKELAALKEGGAEPSAIIAKENEIAKIPGGIKGCVPNGICTAEQANEFFDQLIEFSKYAFNKSHALCYALVAMYTAYQKEYFPGLFYKYTLSNEDKTGGGERPTAKYAEEMASFGYSLLPPKIGYSSSDFRLEGNAIRMGFGNIKGFSYEAYNARNRSVQSFFMCNPTASVADAIVMAKLGMFEDGIWYEKDPEKAKGEKARCEGHNLYIAKFVQEFGEDLKRLVEVSKQMSSEEEGSPEYLRLLTEKDKYADKLKEEKIRQKVDGVPEISEAERKSYLAFETDKLGFCFGIGKEAERLKKYTGKYCDNTFEKFYEDPSNSYGFSVPAIVLSKELSKSGDFYIFDLMDKNGERLSASMWKDKNTSVEEGVFKLRLTDKGYRSIVDVSPMKNIDYENVAAVNKGGQVGGTVKGIVGNHIIYEKASPAEENSSVMER